jgi:hypothetical protein
MAKRIEQRVMAEVKGLQEMPLDFAQGLADVALGATYCKPGIDGAAVESERIGD